MTRPHRHPIADVLFLLGAGALLYGLARISAPLAWIVGGLGAIGAALVLARAEAAE